jgi:hypothetical protein
MLRSGESLAGDPRDILEVLKCELRFLERGGYRQCARTPWKSPSVFLDSPSCINYGDPQRSQPCSECCLIEFVPADSLAESVPCHFISLNADGETVNTLERQAHQAELEETVKAWLRATIARLEAEGVAPTVH